MPSMPKLLVMSLCAAMLVAQVAEARRVGGGRSIGARAPEAASPAMNVNATTNAGAVAARAPESAGARALTGYDAKNAVVAGVGAAAVRASMRNAQADSTETSSTPHPALVAMAPVQSTTVGDMKPSKLDPELLRERQAEALATQLFDQSAARASQQAVEPLKTPAEIARDKKEAEDRAYAAKLEEARKVKLAHEQKCVIEPVMSDKAIRNCQKVFREPV